MFEETAGMFPELVTRSDLEACAAPHSRGRSMRCALDRVAHVVMRSRHLAVAQVFLPPIGGLTVYIFGNAADLRDTSKTLAFRVVRAPPAVSAVSDAVRGVVHASERQ